MNEWPLNWNLLVFLGAERSGSKNPLRWGCPRRFLDQSARFNEDNVVAEVGASTRVSSADATPAWETLPDVNDVVGSSLRADLHGAWVGLGARPGASCIRARRPN